MNKAELVNKVWKSTSSGVLKRDVERVLNEFMNTIIAEVKRGGDVNLIDFGRFSSKIAPERKGRNPRTGESLIVPETKKVVFKAGMGFKNSVKSSV